MPTNLQLCRQPTTLNLIARDELYLQVIYVLNLTRHEQYMHRCLHLAKLAAGYTSPNPMVGAVLVYNDRIIGEGYHKIYGGPHAEVNCINSVREDDKRLIGDATMYVSLEPCAHFGKTPPCADLIIRSGIRKCVIACRDPFNEVNGKGIEKLKSAGVYIETGILQEQAIELNRRFFTFHTKHRPFVILKWAQTADGVIGTDFDSSGNFERLLISNDYSNRIVHRWRSEEAAIIVGTNTALLDDPSLTTRLWHGPSPIRLVIDMKLALPSSLKLFDGSQPTIIFNGIRHDETGNPVYYQLMHDENLVHQVCNALYQLNIQSVIVEGGARLLQSFVDAGMWDEARVIRSHSIYAADNGLKGVSAPEMAVAEKINEIDMMNDTIEFYVPACDKVVNTPL
jgi:diaminohydroxyphosphoribosylaminopyrimidine deaminase/5-amino-6-(5-phosphoribosylamino)uracil reductase